MVVSRVEQRDITSMDDNYNALYALTESDRAVREADRRENISANLQAPTGFLPKGWAKRIINKVVWGNEKPKFSLDELTGNKND